MKALDALKEAVADHLDALAEYLDKIMAIVEDE